MKPAGFAKAVEADNAAFRRWLESASLMDIGMLAKGGDYQSIRDSYVLFLCGFDPFGLGIPLYSVAKYLEMTTSDVEKVAKPI
ncbi:MAG TPA: hypothetical protein DCO86_05115 [Spirochaetaceae bacterium]|nr:hypothetical protein [Spirochaetaceae bacterium]